MENRGSITFPTRARCWSSSRARWTHFTPAYVI